MAAVYMEGKPGGNIRRYSNDVEVRRLSACGGRGPGGYDDEAAVAAADVRRLEMLKKSREEERKNREADFYRNQFISKSTFEDTLNEMNKQINNNINNNNRNNNNNNKKNNNNDADCKEANVSSRNNKINNDNNTNGDNDDDDGDDDDDGGHSYDNDDVINWTDKAVNSSSNKIDESHLTDGFSDDDDDVTNYSRRHSCNNNNNNNNKDDDVRQSWESPFKPEKCWGLETGVSCLKELNLENGLECG
ncbi:hypothetical protein HELRODRAFT_168873 [Helobdella robusta]|uniref:Uncharacterized protein n=1 Tax=Helobdella robusta TaxID=6412 RepID=T1F131_HELRO|nr:hypothetical protein HELRODRAFT_168873 [Helobdella robusta]ESO08951.1 hypothetical protein HELRODRAFT_168873 [Helobdella robusta]